MDYKVNCFAIFDKVNTINCYTTMLQKITSCLKYLFPCCKKKNNNEKEVDDKANSFGIIATGNVEMTINNTFGFDRNTFNIDDDFICVDIPYNNDNFKIA